MCSKRLALGIRPPRSPHSRSGRAPTPRRRTSRRRSPSPRPRRRKLSRRALRLDRARRSRRPHPGDTVFVCAGTYAEGSGQPRQQRARDQAGSDPRRRRRRHVSCRPRTRPRPDRRRRADLRNGKGDIVAVIGQPRQADRRQHLRHHVRRERRLRDRRHCLPSTPRDRSNRSRVTGLVLDESAERLQVPGGFRSNNFGIGVAMVTRVTPDEIKPKTPLTRTLTIDHTRIDQYNAAGVLVDGATTRLRAEPVDAARRRRDPQRRGPDRRPDRRTELVPALQRLHRRRRRRSSSATARLPAAARRSRRRCRSRPARSSARTASA